MTFLYLLTLAALGIFSYSQIDLNLTLLQFPWFLSFQNTMIQLGYYNRPFSTAIFVALLLLLFLFYLLILRQKKLPNLGLLIGGIILITLFSYPAFSHDFFNYLFDARILTHYGQNPYFFKPLDFPADSWLRFMHWVHRPYPYGPAWLLLTLPFSYLGFGKFILTVFNFKLLFTAAYLGSAYLLKKLSPRTLLFFIANPLVVIESLLSPHLDAVMTFFLFLAIFFLVANKKVFSILSLLISVGVKFVTATLLPLFLIKMPLQKFLRASIIISLLTLVPVIFSREIYPWYFLPVFSLAALTDSRKIKVAAVAFSLGLLLQYAPYLYIGSYPPEVQLAKNILVFVPVILLLPWYVAKNFKFP